MESHRIFALHDSRAVCSQFVLHMDTEEIERRVGSSPVDCSSTNHADNHAPLFIAWIWTTTVLLESIFHAGNLSIQPLLMSKLGGKGDFMKKFSSPEEFTSAMLHVTVPFPSVPYF